MILFFLVIKFLLFLSRLHKFNSLISNYEKIRHFRLKLIHLLYNSIEKLINFMERAYNKSSI